MGGEANSMTVSIERRLGRIASGYNARARKYHSLGVVSADTLLVIHRTFGGKCHYCGTELPIEGGTWDHVQALSEGGRNDITNLVRCCLRDQRTKFTKSAPEFAAHKELL